VFGRVTWAVLLKLLACSVARDFVEAPSQMLESWYASTRLFNRFEPLILVYIRCWEPKVLEQMSSHYETKKPLSAELIEKIVKRSVSSSIMRHCRVLTFSAVTRAADMLMLGYSTSVNCSLPSLTSKCTLIKVRNVFNINLICLMILPSLLLTRRWRGLYRTVEHPARIDLDGERS
jgi:hypothetical protein